MDRLANDIPKFSAMDKPRAQPRHRGNGTHISSAVIDTNMATLLGYARPQDAIGQDVRESGAGLHRIVGVVEVQPTTLMTNGYKGQIFMHTNQGSTTLLVRFPNALSGLIIPRIDAAWAESVAGVPVKRQFLSEMFASVYKTPDTCAKITTLLTVLAFLVALAGMAGMVMEHCRQHQRSIAIRRMLGANAGEMTRMLLWQLLRPLLLANLLAWPMAYAASTIYLQMFATRISLAPLPFLIGVAGSLLLALLIVGQEAWRTVHANPVEILRAE